MGSEECSSLGGTSDGSCASGFGVCCVFSLSCGESSSENVTYLSQSSVTSLTSPCTYTICPCSSNICRIRFDLTTFVLSSAVAGTTSSGATGTAASLAGPALGDCVDDSFSISGGLGGGSPGICGTNTGYHMIVDADPSGNSCHYPNFLVGGTTATSRTWEVKVTQYACGDYDSSGWPGCLQYFTATAGNVASFGYPPTATTVTSGVTHLQNQVYDICFRRASGYCYICYTPYVSSTTATAATTDEATQQSYGISISATDANAEAQIASDCSTDWLDIPIANTLANAAISTPTASAVITLLDGVLLFLILLFFSLAGSSLFGGLLLGLSTLSISLLLGGIGVILSLLLGSFGLILGLLLVFLALLGFLFFVFLFILLGLLLLGLIPFLFLLLFLFLLFVFLFLVIFLSLLLLLLSSLGSGFLSNLLFLVSGFLLFLGIAGLLFILSCLLCLLSGFLLLLIIFTFLLV